MFVRWPAHAIGLVLATGCGQIFGLDTPALISDAPVDLASDQDSDGGGDGCMMLPLRTEDDDDSDQLPDPTDNCFGILAAQQDDDGDGVGNACDGHVGKDERFCVWTFRPPGSAEDQSFWSTAWMLPSLNWSVIDSSLRHAESATIETASPAGGVWFESPEGIAFDTRVILSGYTEPFRYGQDLLVSTANGDDIFACQLVKPMNDSAVVELTYNGSVHDMFKINVALPMNISAYVRLSATVEPGKLTVRCLMNAMLIPAIALQHDYPAIALKARPRVFVDQAAVRYDHLALYKLGVP